MELDLNTDLNALYKELQDSLKNPPKKHILAIDDDRNVLKMIKSVLESQYDVTPLVNGRVAMQFFEKKTADLILLDYEMPLMSGAEVLKELRANIRTRSIPVIFLTGVSDADKVREILSLKPFDYILKPINVERLRADIKRALNIK